MKSRILTIQAGLSLGVSLVLLIISCKEPPVEPGLVPVNPADTLIGFVAPVTVIKQGPAHGSIETASSVAFRWEGNSGAGSYSCRLNASSWSPWSTKTDTTFEDLDDTLYLFEVKSRHKNNIIQEQNYPSRSFSVDAVQGPAVLFYPRRKAVTVSQPFSYEIRAEDVSGLLGCKLALTYDPTVIKIDTIVVGDLVKKNGGGVQSFLTRDPSGTKIVLEIVILGVNSKGVAGSGTLATLSCRAVAARQSILEFVKTETLYRDTANRPIAIRDFVAGKVVAQ